MRVLNVTYKIGNYNIFIKKNILSELIKYLKDNFNNKKIAVITDYNLKNLYGKTLNNALIENGFTTKIIAVKPGEESKSIDTLQVMYKELSDFKIKRDDLIITFGGGVVGDLGGFAASTYLRGIQYVQMPTSLLSQVDSSIGGKVAVDLPYGKNLVGSFYNPAAVFMDPEILKSLNKRYLHDGLAEVIKYGCIRDKKIVDKLLKFENDDELLGNIEDIIYDCCSIKKSVVEIDEKDFGERMILNFGHTLGHAIEKYFKYKKYTHGEAVGIGMLCITKNSERMGITEKGTSDIIEAVLKKYELPYEMPAINREDILETIALDKKSCSEGISLILLKGIGEAFIRMTQNNEIDDFI